MAESTLRTWGDTRCNECCNGDRCDDPSHFERQFCPHCKGTGFALWQAARQQSANPAEPDDTAEEDAYVIDRLSKLLAGVAVALKGPEEALHRHSYHDLVEVAQTMKLELDLYRVTYRDTTTTPADAASEADKRRLDRLHDEHWDLRSFCIGDDDVGWRIVEFHMAAPHERVVAEVFKDDPRAAIDAAMQVQRERQQGAQSNG